MVSNIPMPESCSDTHTRTRPFFVGNTLPAVGKKIQIESQRHDMQTRRSAFSLPIFYPPFLPSQSYPFVRCPSRLVKDVGVKDDNFG